MTPEETEAMIATCAQRQLDRAGSVPGHREDFVRLWFTEAGSFDGAEVARRTWMSIKTDVFP